MDGHFHGSDRSSRQKRKRVGFADALSQLKSPCNKTARPGYFNVFLVGFSDKEKADIRRSCTDEIDVKDFVSTAVTHVVVKLPTKKNRHFPYAALYYAVVSGAWILRPSWLSHSKEGILPEGDHEFKHNQVDIQTPLLSKFTQIVSLYERYQKSRDCRGCNIFSHRVFKRVLILTGRTSEGKQKRAALQSLISAGGGSTAVDESWRVIKERPSKAATLISCIIIENGEDLGAHGININFVKQLLMKGVPVLYEEVLSQLLHNEVFPNLEIMMTHAVYYWSNEHPVKLTLSKQELDSVRKICLESENSETEHEVSSNSKFSGSPTVLNSHLTSVKNVNVDASETVEWNWYKGCDDLLDDLEREIKENQLRQKPASLSQTSVADEDKMPLVCLNHEEMVIGTTAENSENALNDCGLFEVFDFSDLQSFIAAPSFEGCSWSDVMLTRSHMIPKALARSGMECGSFPDNLRQFFEALIVEMQNNTPSSFIHDFICHEIVISLQNSLHPSLLPSPDTLSRLFHDIAKPEFGQKFDAASAVYRLLMFFLYQFPTCNEEGRFYWLQVLTDGPLDGACAPSSDRRGSFLEFNNLMSRVAGFRKMVLETFTHDGSSRDLMEFIVSVLEVDLFNMEGCDGLDTSQKSGEEEETCNSSVHSLASKNASLLLEQPQSSSVLCGVPLACIVFYDPHERRKRGLDKASMETCFAIVDNAVNTTSIMCARLSWRLLSVCLEGLRFFLANTLKLFHAEEISIDLQMDVERLGRYLVKKGLSVDEIVCLLPMKWLSDIIRTMG